MKHNGLVEKYLGTEVNLGTEKSYEVRIIIT